MYSLFQLLLSSEMEYKTSPWATISVSSLLQNSTEHSPKTREAEITGIWFWLPCVLTPNRINKRLTVGGPIRSIKEKAIVLFKIQDQWPKLVNHWVSNFKDKKKRKNTKESHQSKDLLYSFLLAKISIMLFLWTTIQWPIKRFALVLMTLSIYTEPEASSCQECSWTMHGLTISYIATLLWFVSSQLDIYYLLLWAARNTLKYRFFHHKAKLVWSYRNSWSRYS